MPRSFLVKKVKLDTFSSADLESSYGRARSDLGVRLQEKVRVGMGLGRRARGSVLEGVEGQRVGLEGPGTPGYRLGGIRTSRRQCLKQTWEGTGMGMGVGRGERRGRPERSQG